MTGTGPTVLRRCLISGLFWLLCLTLSAAGHRLYKATVALDRKISADAYSNPAVPLVWVGHGHLDDAYARVSGRVQEGQSLELHTLPNSSFWLGAMCFFVGCGGIMAWAGRWISNTGIQCLVGLFAGHLLWLGAIELGLDAAGRRLGLAASLEMIGDQIVGTHAAGALIQLSIVFLVPILIGLTMHESNRCAVFQWLRRRLPIARTPVASGRVENYAARTAIQFFMTVWFCYVGVLWLADPAMGRFGQLVLLLVMLAIVVATPYMMWRTACQSSPARSLRYSISGAVVTWTAIEIAASMHLFREPWLSTSLSSGVFFLTLSAVLTGVTICLLIARSANASVVSLSTKVAILLFAIVLGGCSSPDKPELVTLDEIEERLRQYDRETRVPPPDAVDGLLHALVSGDPEMRAQAAVALGKYGQVGSVAQERLESMARGDESRLAQLAALGALDRLGLLSPDLADLRSKMRLAQSRMTDQRE